MPHIHTRALSLAVCSAQVECGCNVNAADCDKMANAMQAGAASKWLSKHRIDPNDPRNAMLLELLRVREAAAHTGQAAGLAGIFRCAIDFGQHYRQWQLACV